MKPIAWLLLPIALLGADPHEEIRALLARKDYRPALEQAQALNRLAPDNILPYQFVAAAHLGLGNYADAERAAQWMMDLRIGKTGIEGWTLIAEIREVTGDFEGAMDAVNHAYQLLSPLENSARAGLLARSGRLQWLAGRLDVAERTLQDALAIAPSDEIARETLAQVNIARGKIAEARAIFQDLAGKSQNPRYLFAAAQAGGSPEEWAEFEHAALERTHAPDNANRELVLYYSGPGKRPDKALTLARREADRRHDVWTMDALAIALVANGNTEDARATIRGVLETGCRYPEILQHASKLGVDPK